MITAQRDLLCLVVRTFSKQSFRIVIKTQFGMAKHLPVPCFSFSQEDLPHLFTRSHTPKNLFSNKISHKKFISERIQFAHCPSPPSLRSFPYVKSIKKDQHLFSHLVLIFGSCALIIHKRPNFWWLCRCPTLGKKSMPTKQALHQCFLWISGYITCANWTLNFYSFIVRHKFSIGRLPLIIFYQFQDHSPFIFQKDNVMLKKSVMEILPISNFFSAESWPFKSFVMICSNVYTCFFIIFLWIYYFTCAHYSGNKGPR